ncbi:MAG: pseudouridine synthase [Actinomycetota bacterium]
MIFRRSRRCSRRLRWLMSSSPDRPQRARPSAGARAPQRTPTKRTPTKPARAPQGAPTKRAPSRPSRPKRKPRPSAEGERLQKVIAAAGVVSRRAAEQLIDQGRVSVDGQVVRVQGMRVDPARARIEVDGERINVDQRHEYIVLNKPAGVVTTAHDPQGRPTVLDLIRARRRVVPVGRLDAETLGLVLLTDHGELIHRLTHPRFQIARVYVAEIKGNVSRDALSALRQGVRLEDGVARASSVRLLRRAASRSLIEITMTEGRKHEVRRMLAAVGFPVVELVRVAFGPVALGALASGKSRRLTAEEVGQLLSATGL